MEGQGDSEGGGAVLIVEVVVPVLVLAAAVGWYGSMASHVHFQCPRCHALFKVDRLRMMFTIHLGLASLVVCPRCGYRAIMPPIRD